MEKKKKKGQNGKYISISWLLGLINQNKEGSTYLIQNCYITLIFLSYGKIYFSIFVKKKKSITLYVFNICFGVFLIF